FLVLFLSPNPARPGSSFNPRVARSQSTRNRRSWATQLIGTIGCLMALSGSILPAVSSFADPRHFTYIYEATIEEPGEVELENWVTWQTRKPVEHGFQEVDFRHEIEFGVTNKLQASVYLADWSYVNSKENEGFVFSNAALELIYQIYNPAKDS